MKLNYQEKERTKAVNLINTTNIFRGGKAGKVFMTKPREFVLFEGEKNLHEPIVNDVINYFSKNKISWWGGSKPTGHVLSSQIACLNHLFEIRNDKKEVLKIAQIISPHFIDVLLIETDKYLQGYIQFEAVSDLNSLNEGIPTRGNNCTSIDALIYAVDKDGKRCLIPIEWKYTEFYGNQNKAFEGSKRNPFDCKGEVRKKRYTELINKSTQLKSEKHECYYFEPFYQLMRQTLWAEQLILNKGEETIKADYYIHVHIIPEENFDLLAKVYKCSKSNMEKTWRDHLKNQAKYQIISPEKLLQNIDKNKYKNLVEYLSVRYWNN